MGLRAVIIGSVAFLGVAVPAVRPAAAADAPACAPGGPAVTYTGGVTPAQARRYLVRPFTVAAGTTRVEVTYDWADNEPALPGTPLTSTVFDLGVWDQRGYRSVAGFRGWSGSRAGRVASGQPPVFIQQDVAMKGYRPGPIQPGEWWLELGIAAVGPTGATWTMTAKCTAPPVGAPFVARPVDASLVAHDAPGWYDGDFHMHDVQSNLRAPSPSAMVAYARTAGLEFLPITEYVTDQHWRELGPVQAANRDVVLWPGREIVTYFGHMIVIGETPHAIEYRHGFEDVSIPAVQRASKADGALFQVAHPMFFPGLLRNACRGCEFELGDVIDWNLVDTLEVLTGPILVTTEQIGLPPVPGQIQHPFAKPAIRLWVDRLMAGNKITAVSGSDSKGVEEPNAMWGTNATSVYAEQLSRAALKRAIQAGHAYVKTKGARQATTLEFTARRPDGSTAIFGDVVRADSAPMQVRVRGGRGQTLTVYRNRQVFRLALIDSDDFTYAFDAARSGDEGPLGTFYRVETADLQSLTTIGNPIFLTHAARVPPSSAAPAVAAGSGGPGTLPATGGGALPYAAVMAAIAAWAAARVATLRSRPSLSRPGTFHGRGST